MRTAALHVWDCARENRGFASRFVFGISTHTHWFWPFVVCICVLGEDACEAFEYIRGL